MCATECLERGAVRVMQLIPESLECTETCETPNAMDYMDYVARVSRCVVSMLAWGYLQVS
jgi:hypothetical protein